MKKKLVVTLLVLALTLSACSSTPSNVAENTEALVATEAMSSVDTENTTEKVGENMEAAPETELATEIVETTESAEETTEAEPEFAVVAMEVTKYAKSCVNVGSENTADSSGTESDYVASTPDAPAPVEDDNPSDDGDMSDWDDFTGGGVFDDCTDGYGPGVEIEINSAP